MKLLFGAVALASALGGCMRSEGYPEAVTVRAFSAPREGSAFVLVHDPWGKPDWRVVPRSDASLLTSLDGVKLTCTNTPCEPTTVPHIVRLSKPAPGVDHVEVLVSKEGFEPVRFNIPFARRGATEGEWDATRVVLLKESAGK